MRTIVSFIVLIHFAFNMLAQQHNLLSSKYSVEELQGIIIPKNVWTPFPQIDDRSGWAKADAKIMQAYVKTAEKYLDYKWPVIPATLSLLFVRDGNRSQYEAVHFERRRVLGTLILAEIAENKGRFIDQIINGVWSICEESWWGVSAHLPGGKEYAGLMDVTKPFIDLFAAETGTFLAWADYFLGNQFDAVSPQIRKRIYNEVNYRLFEPLMNKQHWWTGKNGSKPNNWNPWICSNLLNTALLLEKDSSRRIEMVAEMLGILDNFFNPYFDDGGCDEGPGYWHGAAASMYDNIAMLNLASNNAFKYVYENEKFRNMGRFIYRAQISDVYFLNFADASPKPGMGADIIYRYGKDIQDTDMMNFGAYFRRPPAGTVRDMFFRNLFALFIWDEFQNTEQRLPLLQDVWLPDLQVMAARDKQRTSQGFYLAAKGGHNAESHNHNDVGNFVVYYDGQPLLIDAGSGKYTARTFSSKRYDLWFNCSDFHNLPTVNGMTQRSGGSYKATDVNYRSGKSSAVFSLDIAKAYPKNAEINSWKRTVTLNREKNVIIKDVSDLQNAKSVTQHLLTCYPAEIVKPGTLVIHYSSKDKKTDFVILYNHKQMNAVVEKIKLETEEDQGILSKW
ncbi:MAG: heparinase II/III-family protein, partial [Prevotellaceae bacterium]|nr:heparinase II/III-family protein [Prevotellaceae bacterium]